MHPSRGKVLVLYDAEDCNAVRTLLGRLDREDRLAGDWPASPVLSRLWRDRIRSFVTIADIGILIVSEQALRSLVCQWALSELANQQIPVVLLFVEPVPVAALRSRLKFPNILWEHSRKLPRTQDEIGSLIAGLYREKLNYQFRSRLPTKHQIAEWVGSCAITPVESWSSAMAEFGRAVHSQIAAPTKLSIRELRERRIAALSGEITEYLRTSKDAGQRDRVECSVFAPDVVVRQKRFKIQALLHLQDDFEKAATVAVAADSDARLRATETLQLEIRRGAKVELSLECSDLRIENPTKTIEWQGTARAAAWDAVCNGTEGGAIQARVRAYVAGVPVGYLDFEISVSSDAHSNDGDLNWKPARARAYRKAFISYSRSDIERVSYFAEALECAGIKLSFDMTSLEPGDDWAAWIEAAIPDSDVFYLMWSWNAAKSAWVSREFSLALDLNEVDGTPDVVPVLLERPAPKPPPRLRHLHFGVKYVNLRIGERNPLFI